MAELQKQTEPSEDHMVDLYKALGPDFLDLKYSATAGETTIRSVAWKKGKWRLLFDGPNKDTAEVVLNDTYEIVRVTRIPPKKIEK